MVSLKINDKQRLVFSSNDGLSLVTTVKTKNGITERFNHIANGLPTEVSRVKVNNDGNTIESVKFSIKYAGETAMDGPFTVPLRELETLNWSDLASKFLLNPTFPKGKECLVYIIRAALPEAQEESEYHVCRLGTHVVEGVPVFFTGDRLVKPSVLENKPGIKCKPLTNTRLAIDPDCSEQEAEAGMMRIIDLSQEAGRIIFSFNILNLLREAFTVAGIKPRCCVFLHGKTGIKKTTYAAFQTQLYNRDEPLEPLTRLNASIPAAVKLLYEKSDCVVVLDDLFPAQASEIHRQQEKTLLEITRVVGDGIEPARMRGQKVAKAPPRCGVLFTGEYYVGTGSDAARLLPVRMTIPIDNDKLTACQRKPLILSTFYNFFIEWYITNFDEICELLKEWVAVYRSTKATGIHDRLQETQFCLEAAYKLFLTYRLEKGLVSRETMLEQYHSFYQQLRDIVKEQHVRANQGRGGEHRRVDYLYVLCSLYRGRCFRLVKSIKDFEAKEHDGVIHGDHLYLRREKLMAKIRTVEPLADFDEVLESLKAQQALKPGKDSNSRKIGGSKLRFYAIKLAKL